MTDLLNSGLDRKLMLLSAPAGYGKTTLLSEWVQTHEQDALRVAWVSCDDEDNDPARFWSFVIGALEITEPNISPRPPPAASPSRHCNADRAALAAGALEGARPVARAGQRGTAFPPARDARVSARDGLDLSAEETASLEALTEGWIAGLQLSALSLKDRGASYRAQTRHPVKGVAQKCTLCVYRLEKGQSPFCVANCHQKARILGDLDDPNSQVFRLVNTAYPMQLLSEFGTGPQMYYSLPTGGR